MTEKQITDFIKATFSQQKKTHAVIGLSGGIDSAVCLILTATAIEPQNVFVYHLPSKTSNPNNAEHARLVAKTAGVPDQNFSVVPIGAIIQKSWRIINHYAIMRSNDQAINQLRLANLAARIRMLILFDQAKKLNALVVGTENLSEHLLGYYTRFGDEASDVEPIRHLFKTQVIELAKSLGVSQEIIDKKPSADLWPGQTDERELGFTYQQADPILKLIHQGLSLEEIKNQDFNPNLLEAVLDTVQANSFKNKVPYTLGTFND